MLALRPAHPPDIHARGRSRQVSHAALARQASEVRRVATQSYDETYLVSPPIPLNSPSPSPPDSALMSPTYYDSPPSPPRSLEDQVHVAYALDDIHLAKVLLLRLKGINVTSDDDPRIAAVKDEDFDFCFVPHGRLECHLDDKFTVERDRREKELIEQRNRSDRLRACERIWVQEKRRLREAMQAAIRKREADARRREEEENQIRIEKERAEAERRARLFKRKTRLPSPRNLVSYKITASSPTRDPEPFVYDFMVPPLHIRHTRPLSQTSIASQSSKSGSPFSRPLFDDSRTVYFGQVLTSMEGHLFPPEAGATRPMSNGCSRDIELLDCLLKPVDLDHRRRKGKDRSRPPVTRRDSAKSTASSLCVACSFSSSLSSSPSRLSWLSFSSTSSATSSAPSSAESVSRIRKQSTTWFLASTSSLSPRQTHSCGQLTLISPRESPLTFITQTKHRPPPNTSRRSPRSTLPYAGASSLSDTTTPANIMLRRVSRFLEVAKTFQSAYIHSFSVSSSETLEHTNLERRQRNRKRLGPPGQRVSPADVAVFLHSSSVDENNAGDESLVLVPFPPPIPLMTRYVTLEAAPRTKLPDPLPFPLRFKPLPVPCRSPFRLHAARKWNAARDAEEEEGCSHGLGFDVDDDVRYDRAQPSHSPGATMRGGMVLRVRAVENPVFLRMKAVTNVVRKEGNVTEKVKEGTLGAGKERVLQIAFEGIGRSWLGCDVVWRYEPQQPRGRWRGERERGRREGRGMGKQWWC